MTVLFFFATNEVEVARKNPSGAPFISVDGSVPGAEVTWDHHVTGERINLDAMPEKVPGGFEVYATCLPDIDAAASMVVAALGGECNVLAETSAILRCASHWCDYLSPNPAFDAEQNRLGRGLLDWFNGHRPRLKFGEVDPKDGVWFSEATQNLLDAVISFETGIDFLPYVDDYPKACERAREFYSEGGISFHGIGKCRLALVEPPPGPAKPRAFGPDAVCALLPPDVGVVVYADTTADPHVSKFTVGVNPLSASAPSSLKAALELLAAREFELAQAERRAMPLGAAPIPANKNWGGRPTVFGSPWDGSRLTTGTVVTIVRRALDILHPPRLAWPTRRSQQATARNGSTPVRFRWRAPVQHCTQNQGTTMKLERALGILSIRALSCPSLDSLNDQMSEIAKRDDHLWQQMMFCVAKVNPAETMGLAERERVSRELNERAESLRAQSNVSALETLKKLASCAALLCHEETYRELTPGAGVTLEVLSNLVPSHLFEEAQEHLAQELSSVSFLNKESLSC